MKVMLCKDFELAKVKYPCNISPKLDGVRAFYEPGNSYLISRNEKPIWGMDHVIEMLDLLGVPVDMELIVPGMEFNELSGLIRNHQATPEAVAFIIDATVEGDWLERRQRIKSADWIYTTRFLESNVKLIPHWKVNNYDDIKRLHKVNLRDGHEGSVIKTHDHQYRNTRSYDWMRIVPIQSTDVEVIKFYEGEGKMKGIAGGFYFMFNGHLCKCGTMLGITYGDRLNMLRFPNEYIGRTAVVEYKELQPSGMPRQPRFKGFRDDK